MTYSMRVPIRKYGRAETHPKPVGGKDKVAKSNTRPRNRTKMKTESFFPFCTFKIWKKDGNGYFLYKLEASTDAEKASMNSQIIK